MKRTEIINAVCGAIEADKYLEVGVRTPADNFDHINVADKVGVDPRSHGDYIVRELSDDFFAGLDKGVKWDVIFVDADHSHEQSKVDAINAFEHLSKGGCVILHDTSPVSEDSATPAKPNSGQPWNGEVWKTAVYFRTLKTFRVWTIDADHGVTIIQRAKHDNALPAAPANYAAFAPMRRVALNLLPPESLPDVVEAVRVQKFGVAR